jgi:hypothetical protein
MNQQLFTVVEGHAPGCYGTLEEIRQRWPAILWSDEEILAGTAGGRTFHITDPGARCRLSRCRAGQDLAGLRNLAKPEPVPMADPEEAARLKAIMARVNAMLPDDLRYEGGE